MKTALRIAGIVFTILFVLFAFSKVDWQTFVGTLSSLQYGWVIVAAAFLAASMFFRSLRWYLVTGLPRQALPKVWKASCAGYLGIIYPARAGEVLRMLRLHQLTGLSGGLAVGTAVVDRILDGLSLCGMLLLLLTLWHGGLAAQNGLVLIALLFIAVTFGMIAFVVSGHRLKNLFQRLASLGKTGARVYHWYEGSLAGLQVLRSPQRIAVTLACQVAVSLFDIAVCWALIQAFGWDIHFMASVAVLVYLTAALSLPSTPGYVGIYQTAAIFSLQPFNINNSEAVAYGSVLQVLTLILFIGCGVWAMGDKAGIHGAR